jgi:hypothetical protein
VYFQSKLDLSFLLNKAGTPEVSLDDRKQKHVSFDSSSLMRSQTLATMDEATFHRMQAAQMAQAAQQAQVSSLLKLSHSYFFNSGSRFM